MFLEIVRFIEDDVFNQTGPVSAVNQDAFAISLDDIYRNNNDTFTLDIKVTNNHIYTNLYCYIQSNLNSSNTDGSFTMANSNSFLSPYEILLIVQENKYLRKFSYLS